MCGARPDHVRGPPGPPDRAGPLPDIPDVQNIADVPVVLHASPADFPAAAGPAVTPVPARQLRPA